MMKLPLEYQGSICEIRTAQNEIIAAGNISVINDEYIEIVGKSGAMTVTPFNSDVKINIFNARMGFRVLAGKVYISTTHFIRITDVITLLDYERRHFFRVNTNIPATLQLQKERETEDDEGQPIFDTRIVNLSLGGALTVCNQEFVSGERVVLKLRLGGGSMAFRCVVRRVGETERKSKFYGCQFQSLRTYESDALCAFIFQRQREQIRRPID